MLQAPLRAGKATRVPLTFLDESWLQGLTIIMFNLIGLLPARQWSVWLARWERRSARLLATGVERHSGASLEEFAHKEFDVLALRATKVLRGNPRLASFVFVSTPSFERVENVAGCWEAAVGARAREGAEEKLVSEGELSRTYVFDNPDGHYPHLPLSQLFGVT